MCITKKAIAERLMADVETAPLPDGGATSKASIKVDHRDSRSAVNHALQKVVEAFSSAIMKPGKPFPVGSPRLTPHKSVYKGCHIREYQLEECWLYGFSKLDTSTRERGREKERENAPIHQLFYFAGGGFRGAPTKEHWLLCTELCANLPEYEINLVSYPLAPNSPASKSIPQLEKLYQNIAEQSKSQNTRITLMGDSAGGNIALVLGLYGAASYLKEGGVGVCPIRSILAICPAVDHRNQNPEIDNLDSKDRVLSRKVIESVSELWKGDWSVEDPRVSPILADVSILQKAHIKVDGVLGMDDVLAPDAVLFRDKLAAAGVVGEWLDWEKQMHCFPLMFPYHIHEPVEAKNWILNVLKQNAHSVAS